LISHVSLNLNKGWWIRQLERVYPTLNKYDRLFPTSLDLLPLNLVYFVPENGNFVLENNVSLAGGTMQTPFLTVD